MVSEIQQIECPYCGKVNDNLDYKCPDLIGNFDDDGQGEWIDKFKVIKEISSKIIGVADQYDTSSVFKGIPYWDTIDRSEFADGRLDIIFSSFDHPLISCDSISWEEGLAGSMNYIFVEEKRQKELLKELNTLDNHLDGFELEEISTTIERIDGDKGKEKVDELLILQLQLNEWKDDLIEVHLKNGNIFRIKMTNIQVETMRDSQKTDLVVYGNVTEVIKSDKDTKKKFEVFSGLFFNLTDVHELINIDTGKSWVNLSD